MNKGFVKVIFALSIFLIGVLFLLGVVLESIGLLQFNLSNPKYVRLYLGVEDPRLITCYIDQLPTAPRCIKNY